MNAELTNKLILFDNRHFREHTRAPFGQIDLEKALQVSCNVYFGPLALQVGANKLAEEARNFHLDQPARLELPFETTGMIVPDPE